MYMIYYIQGNAEKGASMVNVYVSELFAVDYPSLEGGYTLEANSIDEAIAELEGSYYLVDEPKKWRDGYSVRVYENGCME